MRITRVAVTAEGGSCFEEMEIELTDAGEIGRLSDPYPASSVVFRENDPSYDYDRHRPPHPDGQRRLPALALHPADLTQH